MEGFAEINGVFSFLHHVDKDVTLALNSLHTPFTDTIWQFLSAREAWMVLAVIIIGILYYRLGWKKATVVLLSTILCVVLCDQSSGIVKASVQRLRPVYDTEMLERGLHVLEHPGALYGFFPGTRPMPPESWYALIWASGPTNLTITAGTLPSWGFADC